MPVMLIEAQNFKSFRNLRLELGTLDVLVGANGAGKSNVLSLLRFMHDAASLGLEDAVSLQGGIGYLSNLALGSSEPFRLQVTLQGLGTHEGSSPFRIRDMATRFSLSLRANEDRPGGFKVLEDEAELTFNVEGRREGKAAGKGRATYHKLGVGSIFYRKQGDRVRQAMQLPEGVNRRDLFPRGSVLAFENEAIPVDLISGPGTLFGTRWFPLWFDLMPLSRQISFQDFGIFDLNVKLSKQAVQFNAKSDLEQDGSNLVIVLRRILANPEQRRMLTNLLRDVLPFVTDIETEQFADRFLLLKLREVYNTDTLPASLLSDGTVYVVALIVALYFSRRSLIAIEEPEKHIHPYLIARVARMLKDAARNTPIVVTTQNPELVRHVNLESLLLVIRDRDGFSTIQRPSESQEVQVFLQNEIGIDELFAQNLLKA